MKFSTTLFGDAKATLQNQIEPEHVRAEGRSYWRTMLIVAFVIVVCAILYGVWQLFMIFSFFDGSGDAHSATPQEPIKRVQLTETIQRLDQRATVLGELMKSSLVEIDPAR